MMYIDHNNEWHCNNCHYSGTYDDVKKHEEAVALGRKILNKDKLKIKGIKHEKSK